MIIIPFSLKNIKKNTKVMINNGKKHVLNFRKRINKENFLALLDSHIINYPTPSNLNYFWSFGATAGICLVFQLLSGIFVTLHYTADATLAFNSVEHIMRDVNNGWIIRYLHCNCASTFFIVVYAHIFRGIFYGSYIYPREKLWVSGILLFILMMATAFMGYVLPWGQMSFWGATVITNLFSAVPLAGELIVEWIWGDYSVGGTALKRFFCFHFLLPFILSALTLMHLNYLHEQGSNNPLGINTNVDNIKFFPAFFVKDLFAFFILIVILSYFIFFFPNILGHPDNYTEANPLVTPAHIVPEWYFLPFYAILRSIPDKLGGIVAMFGAIVVLLILPFLNTSKIRSSHFRPIYILFFWLLVLTFLVLGWIGQKPVETPYIEIGQAASFYYFFYFLIFIPAIGHIENYLLTWTGIEEEPPFYGWVGDEYVIDTRI